MFEVNKWLEKKVFGMGVFFEYAVCPMLVNQAKTKAYWKDRTGHARQNINGGVEGSSSEIELYLAHGTEYGEWLERGTGIYGPTKKPIVPVNKSVLSWVDTSGKRHFAKSVKGMKPMPILEDTFTDNKELIIKVIEKYWEG
ncbi:hypothetical protein [Clostridium ihumii]|uniref:hypothetical protein n=1 Tax=Clostridium ihumii TaxID=1470356 RepID=UPI00058EBA96|nr:hypothetical protein [Clostridium ihumii]